MLVFFPRLIPLANFFSHILLTLACLVIFHIHKIENYLTKLVFFDKN